MKKNWNQIIDEAKLLFDFLDHPVLLDKTYIASSASQRVIFDITQAERFSTDDSGVNCVDWQGLLDAFTPPWPAMPRKIEKEILCVLDRITKERYPNVRSELLINNVQGDISRLLHCYAYGEVPQLWQVVQQVYLNGAIPCGWEGSYPDGRMVVFSVQPEAA
jgi:hypothetical protein